MGSVKTTVIFTGALASRGKENNRDQSLKNSVSTEVWYSENCVCLTTFTTRSLFCLESFAASLLKEVTE